MKAYVIRTYGGPGNFELTDLPRPQIRPGHVLLQVKASSVNPLDYKIRRGDAASIGPALPAVLHGDVAGTVVEIGEGVEGFQLGDVVYGCAGGVKGIPGSLAEMMLADARLMAPVPKNLPPEEAAVLPLVSITAWQALMDRVRLQPGQTVLVMGGTGGVGHIGVQLAKWKGARVFATCGNTEKMKLARSLGADEVILYKEEGVADYVKRLTGGEGFDVVFDTVGLWEEAIGAVRINGQIATTLALGPGELSGAFMKNLSIHFILMLVPLLQGLGREHQGYILRQIGGLVEAEQLKPLVHSRRYLFSEISQAHREAESGSIAGKICLVASW
ncbi:MAG: quinone oxidoreductase [Nitrospinae bacterium CG11_big_fil_rev_8_21_14_0_20_56_8]|nr:MAG: quinone oxidoreductase [Nitrospinae bacterium CG11_big_fil_rev_8_21_14_0_20_56_8]